MTLTAGTRLGAYEILVPLGAGGMGEVYRARDSKLKRDVAIKVLPKALTEDPSALARFEGEALAVAALSHPNILAIYDFGADGGIAYAVMELLDGETLRAKLTPAPPPQKLALDYALQIAKGLAAAHQKGVVHRDMKPENVFVGNDGHVKILDFGLAKRTAPAETEDGTCASTGPLGTEPGTVMGTLGYMSPEQVRGRDVDHRSDIFSFGTMLYEMLSGKRAFKRDSAAETMSAILNEEPPALTDLSRNIPVALEHIVKHCLEKSVVQRFQSARDVAFAIETLSSPATSAPTVRRTSSAEYVVSEITHHKPGVALVLITVVVAVTAIGSWFSGITRRNRSPALPKAMTITRPVANDRVREAAISPDGKYVAYVVAECCLQQSLRLRQLASASDIQIDPPSGLNHQGLTFSPDGTSLYFTDNSGSLYQMSTIGGSKTKVITGVNSAIGFSPDGKRLAFLRNNYPAKNAMALMVANADGSGEVKIASRQKPDFFGGAPAWSPNGQAIACAAGSVDGRGRYVNVREIQFPDGKERPITSERWNDVGPVVWLSDGSGLLMIAEDQNSMFFPQVWQVSYPDGDARRVTNGLNSYEGLSVTSDSSLLVTGQKSHASNVWIASTTVQARQLTAGTTGSYDELSWLSAEDLMYESNTGGSWDIWRLDVENGTRRQLTINGGGNADSSASPDGRYVLFASNRAGPANIWRMDPDGANSKQLTNGNGLDEFPQGTSDGKWVVYESTRSDKATLWKVAIDGGDPVQLTDRPSRNAAISPDGKWIVYESEDSGERSLWKVSIDGGDPVHLVDKPSGRPVISPDGTLIACRYQPDPAKDDWKVAVVSFDGGQPIQLFDIPAHPFWDRLGVRWSQGGKALTYRVGHEGIDNIWSQLLAGGRPKQLTHFDSDQIYSFAWSPKGRLALSRGTETRDVILLKDFR